MPRTLISRTGLWLALLLASASPAAAVDKVTFQLDWLPGGDKAPLYVGLEQGFFSEQHLDVKISQGRGSTDALTKLATGISDIGYSDLSALLAASAQDTLGVSAVMSVFSEAPHAFFTLQDSGISTVGDVQGKSIATSAFTSSNVFLPLLLNINDIPQDSIRLIKADAGALGPMLVTGNVDVIISWLTDAVKYQAQARSVGKELVVLPWYDAGLEFYATTLVANDDFLRSRPEVAKRFLKAYAKAIAYTWEHPDKAAAAVHSIVPEVDIEVAADTIRSIRGLVYNEASAAHGVGVIDTQRMATSWAWVARSQGFSEDALDPEQVVNRDIMAVIAPERPAVSGAGQ